MATNSKQPTPSASASKSASRSGYPEKQPGDKADAQQEVQKKPPSPDDEGNPAEAEADD